jgi:hypothetical protein
LILKNGFAWIKDTKVWTYIIAIMAIGIIGLIGISYMIQGFAGNQLSFSVASGSNPISALLMVLNFILIIFVFYLVLSLIQGFVYVLILLKGMKFYQIKTQQFGIAKYVKLIILWIASAILALISYHERKFFYVFIAILALYFVGILTLVIGIGLILLLIAFLASMFYVFVVIYNSIRLSMSQFVFLEKEQGIFASIRESWNLTSGKAADVFIAIIIVSVVVMVVSMFAGHIGDFFSSVLFPELANPGQSNPLALLSIVKENIGLLILISGIPAVTTGTIMEAFKAYCFVGIYSEVKKSK